MQRARTPALLGVAACPCSSSGISTSVWVVWFGRNMLLETAGPPSPQQQLVHRPRPPQEPRRHGSGITCCTFSKSPTSTSVSSASSDSASSGSAFFEAWHDRPLSEFAGHRSPKNGPARRKATCPLRPEKDCSRSSRRVGSFARRGTDSSGHLAGLQVGPAGHQRLATFSQPFNLLFLTRRHDHNLLPNNLVWREKP